MSARKRQATSSSANEDGIAWRGGPRSRSIQGRLRPGHRSRLDGELPNAIRACIAVANSHSDKTGRADLSLDGKRSVPGIVEYSVRDADWIAVAAVAVALFGHNQHTPKPIVVWQRYSWSRCETE